jgi:hypothetical protein
MTIERIDLAPQPEPRSRTNVLTVKVPDIRRAYVLLHRSLNTRGDTSEVYWTLSAWVTLSAPLVANAPGSNLVTLAPSKLHIAPLGAGLMLVAAAFWPGLPTAEAISIKFSTRADEPQGDAQAFAVGDATPTNEFGLFPAPHGHARHPQRIVEPLPDDPAILEQLQLEGRVLPPVYPPRRTPRER